MLQELQNLEELGLVRAVKHNKLPLTVFNYTPRAQFEQAFGEYPLLKLCRGLVLSNDGEIVSYPLKKFFNWEELDVSERPIIGDKIEITEKMDGSLLIVSKFNDELIFNTRGSFTSDQSLAGEQLFYSLYDKNWIESGRTYLFEYISPDNRIVVQYNDPKLIHLAVIDTITGKDLDRDSRFECVQVYELNGGLFGEELYELFMTMNLDNKEGFVIRQLLDEPQQNFRMKWKCETYKVLHRLVTGVSNRSVWEFLRDGKDFDEIIEICPDEFNTWLKKTKSELEYDFDVIENTARFAYLQVKDMDTRKEQAMYLIKHFKDVSGVVFKMLDDSDYKPSIWGMVKPEKYVQPFTNKGEE